MQINRQSYEECFLLYTDGELGLDEKKAVEDFIKENPDLEQELILMQQTVFAPDDSIVFEDKEQLYRKEEERKVIPWFRLAAAAILLITFSIFGWLYLNNKQPVVTDRVASSDMVPAKQEPLKKVEPVVTSTDEKPSPSKIIERKQNIVELYKNSSLIAATKSTDVKDEPPLTGNSSTPVITTVPEHAEFEQNVVKTVLPAEDVEIPVTARTIKSQPETAISEEPNTNVTYVEGEETDMIYFANTSLPKKTKLRGVIRKATRILDKVTSFQ